MVKRQIKQHGNSFIIKLEPIDIKENNLKIGDMVDVLLGNDANDIQELIASSNDFIKSMEDRQSMKKLLKEEITEDLMKNVEDLVYKKIKKELEAEK